MLDPVAYVRLRFSSQYLVLLPKTWELVALRTRGVMKSSCRPMKWT